MNNHSMLEHLNMAAAKSFAHCVCGSASDIRVLARALNSQKPSLLLTDPPYCILTRRRKGGDVRDKREYKKIDHDSVRKFEDVREYRKFTESWLPLALSVLNLNATVVLWTNFLGKQPLLDVAGAHGYGTLVGEFTWAKLTTQKDGNERQARVYEVALILKPTEYTLPPLKPQDAARPWAVVAGYDDDGEASKWQSHPNHKPFSVLEPIIRTWSQPGETVLDCFSGSGSIPAAALRLNRSIACCELDPQWVNVVNNRIQELIHSNNFI